MFVHSFTFKISALCIFIILLTCSNPGEADNDVEFQFDIPVATGIIITDSQGNTLGRWGLPSSNSGYDDQYDPYSTHSDQGEQYKTKKELDIEPIPGIVYDRRFYVPYPNPSDRYFTIDFTVSEFSHIKLYVVPAQYRGSDPEDSQATLFGSYNKPGCASVATLMNRQVNAGSYSVYFNAVDFPDGFYRVYVKIDGERLWHDILKIENPENMPPGLKEFFHYK